VYKIDGEFGLGESVPPEAMKGAWPVGSDRVVNGDFVANRRVRPDRDCGRFSLTSYAPVRWWGVW